MPESKVDIEFADGEYTFALPGPRIEELQAKCNIGIGGLCARVSKGFVVIEGGLYQDPERAEFYLSDIIETIRQGLIGGNHGMVDGADITVSPALANRLIQNYVSDRPLTEFWTLAYSILGTCIKGFDPPKKAGPASKRATETETAD